MRVVEHHSPSAGATDVDVVVVRESKNLTGRVLESALGTVGKHAS